MAAPRSTSRERIITEAMALFASQGFAGTSITAIEQAAGLAKGGGGVYKHFPSKRAVLEAGIARYEQSQDRALQIDPAFDAVALDDALAFVARFALVQLDDQRQLIRVLFRELDPFPELLAGLRENYIQRTYAFFAGWLDERRRRGQVRADVDTTAAAAVAVGALVNYRVLETFLGEPPGRVDDERFVTTWVSMTAAALRPGS